MYKLAEFRKGLKRNNMSTYNRDTLQRISYSSLCIAKDSSYSIDVRYDAAKVRQRALNLMFGLRPS